MYGSTVVPAVTETTPVPELMKFLRCFNDNQFDQVENIMINRENMFKAALGQLRKQIHLLEEERDKMMQKHAAFAELERMKYENECSLSKKYCDELKEKLLRLNADHQLVSGREKELEERYKELVKKLDCVEKEKSRITTELCEKIEEKNHIILELNEKMEVLKEEKGQVVLECSEKMEVLKQEMELRAELYKKKVGEKFLEYKEIIANMLCEHRLPNSPGTGSSYFQSTGPQPTTDLDYNNGMPTGEQLTFEAGGTGSLTDPSRKTTGQQGSAPVIIDLSVGDDDTPTGLPTGIGRRGMAPKNECSGLDIEQTGRDCRGSYLINFCTKRKRSTSGEQI